MPWFAELSVSHVALLGAGSFVGSLLSAALGVGGGSLLILVMANLLPPMALIPVHGAVQLGSNAGRAYLTRHHCQVPVVAWFSVGAVIAALAATTLLNRFDAQWIPPLCALFILYLSWGPVPNIGLGEKPAGLFFGGLLTTGLTMLVGATGPLVSAWLGRSGGKWHYTANFSACMSSQHLLKLVAFAVIGFGYHHWLGLIVLMIATGYLGTKVGLILLNKLPEKQFRWVFRVVLTLLALRILWLTGAEIVSGS